MARFLKLTNAYKGPNNMAGHPVVVNIYHIVTITPWEDHPNNPRKSNYENPQTWVTTSLPEDAFVVQEPMEKILAALPI